MTHNSMTHNLNLINQAPWFEIRKRGDGSVGEKEAQIYLSLSFINTGNTIFYQKPFIEPKTKFGNVDNKIREPDYIITNNDKLQARR